MYKKFSRYRIIHEAKYLLYLYLLAILTLQLFFCQTVTANSANRGYTPPVNQKSTTAQRRQAAGSRGCGVEENSISLNLLEPQNSEFPPQKNNQIVVFDISAIPKHPVIVTLTQPNVIEPVFETEININRPGIWTITAEPKVPLSENQHYVVTVLIPCNISNSSQSIYVRSLYLSAVKESTAY